MSARGVCGNHSRGARALLCSRGRLAALFTGVGLLAVSSSAATWTVDNNPEHVADFRSLQEAHDDAGVNHGDIIYIAGSGTPYAGATLIKSLTVYGPGYYLVENRPPVNSLASAIVDGITLTSTPGGGFDPPSSSAGSTLMGLHITGVFRSVRVLVDDITIQRCRLRLLDVCVAVSNLTVLQSIVSDIWGCNGSFVPVSAGNNVLVANCYLETLLLGSGVNGAVIRNNIIGSQLVVAGADSDVSNNILLFTNPASLFFAGQFHHNMLAAAASFLPAENGNTNMVNPVLVFVDSGTPDGQWQLKPGGPAVGAGSMGADMGMFGGPTPYVLSGLPPLPTVVIDADATGTGLSGLQIRVEGHAHN